MGSGRWGRRAQLGAEFGLRILLVVLVWREFPEVYWVDAGHYWSAFRNLGLHHLPYRDFPWEFPPLTVLPAAAAALFRSSRYWYGVFLGVLMSGLELTSLEVLRRHRPEQRHLISGYWYGAGLLIAVLGWFRLDFVAVLPAAIALVRLLDGRRATGPVTLGVLGKLWPSILALVPVWSRRSRQSLAAATAVAVAVAVWFVFSPSGFRAFLRYRSGTGFHVESLVGSVRFLTTGQRPVFRSGAWVVDAGRNSWVEPALLLAWVVLVAAVTWAALRRPTRPVHVPALVGGLLATLMLASRLLSPQYLVWLLPFLVLARVDGERLATGFFVASVLATTLYLWGYAQMLDRNVVLDALVVVRDALLLVTGAGLIAWAFGARRGVAEVVTSRR